MLFLKNTEIQFIFSQFIITKTNLREIYTKFIETAKNWISKNHFIYMISLTVLWTFFVFYEKIDWFIYIFLYNLHNLSKGTVLYLFHLNIIINLWNYGFLASQKPQEVRTRFRVRVAVLHRCVGSTFGIGCHLHE